MTENVMVAVADVAVSVAVIVSVAGVMLAR